MTQLKQQKNKERCYYFGSTSP